MAGRGPLRLAAGVAALADKAYGNADFTVGATASSGLAVSFAASGNCTVLGTTVHLTGNGSCTITASQAGNANYTAAAAVPLLPAPMTTRSTSSLWTSTSRAILPVDE